MFNGNNKYECKKSFFSGKFLAYKWLLSLKVVELWVRGEMIPNGCLQQHALKHDLLESNFVLVVMLSNLVWLASTFRIIAFV